MFKKKITAKILLLLIASDVLETGIHFFFKKTALASSAGPVTGFAGALAFLQGAVFSPYLWAGLILVVTVFVLWSLALSKIDLSVAVPVASFSYIMVPLVSIAFLHEKVTPGRWLGVFLILAGVILVSLSSKEKVEA